MRHSRSSLLPLCNLSTPKLSTLLLAILIFSTLFSTGAFAQDARKKMVPSEGNDRDQEQKRAEWNMRGREAPKGESAAALRLRAHQQKMAMRAQRQAAARAAGIPFGSASTNWVNLGPAPLASDATGNGSQDYHSVSGRATSVLVDPADTTGNTILLGGAYGGLWKSTNAGSKSATPDLVIWQALIDDQPSLAVGAIALQPGNSNLILVGTGETNSSGDSYYGMGILRSTDGGTTWTQITQDANQTHSFLGVGFSKMAFSTSNTNLVVASTAGDIGFDYGLEQDGVSTARGIYYSTDAGATWNRVTLSDGAVAASVTGVVYNPSQGANGTFYAAIRRHGIYSSTDGQHFTRLATQPTPGLASANCPANANSTNCRIYRAEFAVTPGRNEMYVWVVDNQSGVGEVDDGIWKTTNGGTAWTQVPDNGIQNCGSGGGGEGAGGTGSGCGVEQGLYNLELAAIPNSTGTDVYAGTINLYKCHLASGASSCSTIDSNVPNDWINLTHVYGCPTLGELAHVHPDQHGLAFLVVGAKAPGYFAHDGGISRTLDGYTGLDSGTCTISNQFDSLSQTLGSMTEFVSFSVHPTSTDILLGGTQDNGSPKTATATTSTSWQNALSGDGGYNVINPNPGPAPFGDGVAGDEWFVSQPDSNIYVCEDGTACNDNDTFGEAFPGYPSAGNIDQGPFYTPYILDPQNTNEMLIGTCRVWRGDTATGTFSELSVNFDTLDTTLCTGSEINQVAGVAAGGPQDANGFSNVVYATTFGYGPFAGTVPPGGEVWETTNAAAATPAMTNVTGSINPNHYAIAAVAIDTSVINGQTAYVGIMGFHTSHVWKTANAGTSWTDWTGSGGTALPDAPVSSLLVDPAAGIIYAGTDVGVFSSPTTGAGGVWTEVGPVAGPGSGFLPSAPVTAIRIFINGTTKKLRVSTYGRGIWEFNLAATPDFTLSASPSSLSIAPGGAGGTSTITVNPTGGFTGTVSLAASGLPSGVTASFNPASTTTTSTLTLTASGSATVGTATVTITGTSGSLTHTTTVTLTVTSAPNFTLSAAPSSLTITPTLAGGTSTITVTPANGFTGSVSLTASGLPSGVTASFNPSSTTTTSVLTLTASGSASAGTATVTITGTSGSLTATTTIALTVTAGPSFTLSANPTSVTITPFLAGGTSTITVNPANGFTGSVSLSASGLPAGVTAAFTTNPTIATSTLTLTASGSATAGTATVTITGISGSLTQTTTIALTVTPAPNFTLSAAPSSVTITPTLAGGTSTITVTPTNGFTGSVTLSAAGLPAGVTAAFTTNPTTATSTLTLTASGSAAAGTATVTITGVSGSLTHTTTVALTVNQNFTLSTPTTPAPVLSGESTTSTFTVTADGGAATFTSAVTFGTPPCNGLPDATVTCSISSIAQGATSPQTVTLTIKTTGPNTAAGKAPQRRQADNRSPWLPLALPLAGIVVAAFAGRKMSRYSAVGALCVSLVLLGLLVACGSNSTPPQVSVSVSPAGSTLFPNDSADSWPPQTATFTATVTNNSNTAVNWTVTPANAGSITSAGVYTAPTIAVGLPGSATITATSQADTTKSATATVTITPSTVPTSIVGAPYSITVTATEGSVPNNTSAIKLTVQ